MVIKGCEEGRNGAAEGREAGGRGGGRGVIAELTCTHVYSAGVLIANY